MKAIVVAAAALLSVLASATASADPTVTTTLVMPTRTIYGRIEKPLVVIVVKAPTAAAEATAAHSALRESMMRRYEPATLHVQP